MSCRSGPPGARAVLAEQTLLPLAARRAGVDILHNLFTTAPARPGVPQVTTIHDLIYKRFPEAHAGLRSLGMRALVPLAARRSSRIIAISEGDQERRRLLPRRGSGQGRRHLRGPGFPPADPEPEDALRRRYSLGEAPIVLSVSAHRPHKNIERLIDAIAAIEGPVVLVIPGYETRWEDDLRAHVRRVGASERVRFLGWISDGELEGL